MSLSTQQDGGEWVPQGEVGIDCILISSNVLHLNSIDFKVDFRIVYDDDVYGARIIAEGPTAEGDDEYNVICNHLIGEASYYPWELINVHHFIDIFSSAMQTILADDMSWSALDFSMDPPTYRFKVVLSSIIEYLSLS